MPLESLLKLAETLKQRVSVHAAALGASETLTRYALIDPLLRELGWDTSDPAAVVPEYSSGPGRADYALMSAGSPAVMVEAKKLGTPLQYNVLGQVLTYCMMEGTEHFVVTNGARWEIYETNKSGSIDQKLVAEFDLSADSPASVCLKALALWRPGVEAGSVAPAQTPAIGLAKPVDVVPQPAPVTVIQPLPDIQGDWHRFSDTEYATGRKPVELLFLDNTQAGLKGWFSLLVETTRWLADNGYLTKAHCPITLAGRIIVDTRPIYRDGMTTKQVEVNGFYVDRYNQVKVHFKRAMAVIERVGQDSSQFRVRFA